HVQPLALWPYQHGFGRGPSGQMSVEVEQSDVIHPVRRARRTGGMTLAAIGLLFTTLVAGWVVSLGPLPLREAHEVSTTIVDRHGKLLRAYAMADGRARVPDHAAA